MTASTGTYGVLVSTLVLLIAGCGQQEQSVQNATESKISLPTVALERFGMGAPPASEGGNCSLDTINGQPVAAASVKVGDEAIFVGWAGDAQGEVPMEARLVLSGEGGVYGAPVQTGTERPDVVAALGKPGLARSGFGISTVLAVDPGTYRISIMMGAAQAVECQFDVSVNLAES